MQLNEQLLNSISETIIKLRADMLDDFKAKLKDALGRKPNWSRTEVMTEVGNIIHDINNPKDGGG